VYQTLCSGFLANQIRTNAYFCQRYANVPYNRQDTDQAALSCKVDHLNNRIAFSDFSKELIAKAFALGSSFDETSNVNKFDSRWDDSRRTPNPRQDVQPFVGDSDCARVRLNCAEGKVCCLSLGAFAQGVEKRRLRETMREEVTTNNSS
jgi:hypothetical protein